MRFNKKLALIVIGYQVVPLVLTAAWIMPAFFDLFGVSWSDRTWRMYAATTGGWLILEAPLVIFLCVRIVSPRKVEGEPNQPLEPSRHAH